MKAIGLTEFGGPEVLRVVDLPEPEPGPGELRIRVHAVPVNPTDITFRAGGRAAQLAGRPAPFIPGMDAAGVLDKLGEDSDGRLAVGDRVIAYVIPFGPHGGSYAEKVVVPAASVVPAPSGASFPEASTLLLNATTARLSLDALALPSRCGRGRRRRRWRRRRLRDPAGEGGRAHVLAAAAASDDKLVRSLGADAVVDARTGIAAAIRGQLPDGAPGLIDTAALDGLALPAVADGGGLVTLKGWNG
jgi:NADPH2:quinone reductase